MRARYYSPTLRRFVNADKVHGDITNALTLNRYSFCNGDPANGIDPTGFSKERGGSKSSYKIGLDFSYNVMPTVQVCCLVNTQNTQYQFANIQPDKPGKLYSSVDEAARGFAFYINAKSIEENAEYASFIYAVSDDSYFPRLIKYIFNFGNYKKMFTPDENTQYTFVEPERLPDDEDPHQTSVIPANWDI